MAHRRRKGLCLGDGEGFRKILDFSFIHFNPLPHSMKEWRQLTEMQQLSNFKN